MRPKISDQENLKNKSISTKDFTKVNFPEQAVSSARRQSSQESNHQVFFYPPAHPGYEKCLNQVRMVEKPLKYTPNPPLVLSTTAS